jgi:ADP-heptose:LPS heptosyltransferase
VTRPVALVLRALGLGDLVTGLPALRLLRTVRPGHDVLLATPGVWAPIVSRFDPAVEVLPTAELAPITGAPDQPDLAIDLHGNRMRSTRLLLATRPRQLVSYATGGCDWDPGEHEVARWCRLLREELPVRGWAPDPRLAGILGRPPEASVPQGRTVVHCGAGSPSRVWPAERSAALALLLAAEGHDVVVTGGPGEEEAAELVAHGARVPALTGLSVTELMALVGTARLVVSGDTGIAHLACAYETPTVTLFGPVSPACWGPPRRPRHRVVWHGDGTGDPHGRSVDRALARISVREAAAEARTADRVARAND